MQIELDDWQREVLQTEGNILLISGRRVGKSEVLSIDAAEFAANNEKKQVLVISHTERQAYWLFEKILEHLYKYYKGFVKRGKDKPTKSQVKLTNSSIIRCLPTGLSGSGIRGIPADRIYPDEMDYIPEEVWAAITPMLLTTGGVIRGGTTPNPNKERGYVYNSCYKNPKFKIFHVSTEEVVQNRKISESWTQEQRKAAIEHLENEKKTMTKLNYAVEYLGQWVDQMKRFFEEELIQKCCTLKRDKDNVQGKLYLGCDFARMGEDKSSFQILNKKENDKYIHIESITTEKTYTTETYDKIIQLNNYYNFRKIGLDAGSGSIGVGILDFLMRESKVSSKVVALNNRSRLTDVDGKKKLTLMKEDMYQNLKAMMEHGQIQLLADDDVIISLRSVSFDVEITPQERTLNKVFSHVNSDIVEGLIRAAWLAHEDKSLKLFATSSNHGQSRYF